MTAKRTLHLLRHAHSSWAIPGQRDHQRPLDERGRAEAHRLAQSFGARGLSIGHVVCSTAKRAVETLQGILPALPATTEVEMSDALYASGPEAYRAAVERRRDVDDLLLVGHNPTIEDWILALCPSGEPDALRSARAGFGTAHWAVIGLPDAGRCEDGSGYLRAILRS